MRIRMLFDITDPEFGNRIVFKEGEEFDVDETVSDDFYVLKEFDDMTYGVHKSSCGQSFVEVC